MDEEYWSVVHRKQKFQAIAQISNIKTLEWGLGRSVFQKLLKLLYCASLIENHWSTFLLFYQFWYYDYIIWTKWIEEILPYWNNRICKMEKFYLFELLVKTFGLDAFWRKIQIGKLTYEKLPNFINSKNANQNIDLSFPFCTLLRNLIAFSAVEVLRKNHSYTFGWKKNR